MKKLLIATLSLVLGACTYQASQIDVTVNINAKSLADNDATVCAKISYIDANLTDMGHKFATRTICKNGYVDQTGRLSIEFIESVSDWSSKYQPRRAENFTADIRDVKFYIRTRSGPLAPTSVNTSNLRVYDHYVSGSVNLKF